MELGPILFTSGGHGIYVPRNFAKNVVREQVEGVKPEEWDVLLAGPEHEDYWEVWEAVLRSAILHDREGRKFTLWQEGDLWCIPEGWTFDDSRWCWVPPGEGEKEVES